MVSADAWAHGDPCCFCAYPTTSTTECAFNPADSQWQFQSPSLRSFESSRSPEATYPKAQGRSFRVSLLFSLRLQQHVEQQRNQLSMPIRDLEKVNLGSGISYRVRSTNVGWAYDQPLKKYILGITSPLFSSNILLQAQGLGQSCSAAWPAEPSSLKLENQLTNQRLPITWHIFLYKISFQPPNLVAPPQPPPPGCPTARSASLLSTNKKSDPLKRDASPRPSTCRPLQLGAEKKDTRRTPAAPAARRNISPTASRGLGNFCSKKLQGIFSAKGVQDLPVDSQSSSNICTRGFSGWRSSSDSVRSRRTFLTSFWSKYRRASCTCCSWSKSAIVGSFSSLTTRTSLLLTEQQRRSESCILFIDDISVSVMSRVGFFAMHGVEMSLMPSFLPMIGSSSPSWQRLCALKDSSGQHLVFQQLMNQILLLLLLLQKEAVDGLILASTTQHNDTEFLNKITADSRYVFESRQRDVSTPRHHPIDKRLFFIWIW